ncbi:unnamed protein product [Cylicocyclus nassatus]|uniref:Uncharacterized protein n=1 Tax=Cylicocyclus nassatus TaxID=53992 RepID=A0AA36HCJ4_CYLNA|nr:unnamed protein product [Cylicocyclus nassatus]
MLTYASIVFGEEQPLGQFSYAVWNVYLAVSFAAVVWSSLAAIGELQRLLQCSLGNMCSRGQPATIQRMSAKVHDLHCTTERYFNQLESAWGQHAKF